MLAGASAVAGPSGNHRVRPVRAAAHVLRRRRAHEESRAPRRRVLGTSGPWFRRSGRARPRAGPGAGRARREPHRPRVHRRRLRRLPDDRHARRRVRQHQDVASGRRRTRADRRVHRGGRALRAARQQAGAGGNRRVPRPPGQRDGCAREPARDRVPRPDRVRRRLAAARQPRRGATSAARLHARRRVSRA